jgi:8-oxo-dGTP diphosphatase
VDVSRTSTVRAAGGIVHRPGPDGEAEVLLVHRPRYDDWSLPKGKADDGERDEDTALREVEEETGLRCTLGAPAGETRYRDSKGRDKVVHYWLMEPPSGDAVFVPNDEVDAVRWCTVRAAGRRLSYAHDRKLLAQAPVPA